MTCPRRRTFDTGLARFAVGLVAPAFKEQRRSQDGASCKEHVVDGRDERRVECVQGLEERRKRTGEQMGAVRERNDRAEIADGSSRPETKEKKECGKKG